MRGTNPGLAAALHESLEIDGRVLAAEEEISLTQKMPIPAAFLFLSIRI